MMLETFVATFCGSIVCMVCVFLVLHPEYDDGLIGRLALSMIGIAGLARFLGGVDALIHGHPIVMTNVGMMLWIGASIFFGRHAWRFLHYKGMEGKRRMVK